MTMFRNAAASFATTVALGLATFTFVMPAHAAGVADVQVTDGVPSVQVSFADLDLSNADGRATLQSRLDRAVKQVCHVVADQAEPLKSHLTFERCREEAGDKAHERFTAVLGQRKLAQR